MVVVLWVILGVALAVAEIFTTTLFLIMFSAGAVAAAAAAALGASVPVQAGVFVAVSALTIAAVRPVLRRHLSRPDPLDMGVEPMQGASAVVVEHVNADHGMVKIGGELWQARSVQGFGNYSPGERVRIVDISEGIALVWREGVPGITDHQL
jgi:membrane protein implicated in regulation of membrane protease activity